MPVLLKAKVERIKDYQKRKPMAKKIKVKVFDELRESLQDALAF